MTADRIGDKFIALNGLRFHYRDWEGEGAPTLILLHGFARMARDWDPFAREMQKRYRVLALDQRGHGETEWAEDYSRVRMLEDLDAFVRALELQRIILLGHSMGGRIAYSYAASHPDVVEKLVIVDMGPEIMSSGVLRVQTIVQAKDVFDSPEEAFHWAHAQNPRPPEAEQRARTLANLKPREDGKWTWRYDPALREPNRPMPRPDPEAQWEMLRKIKCPMLIVRGAESDILSREAAERMAREIPNARLVQVPNSGHGVHTDNPSGFVEAVREFLISG